jgi:acyl dehydratase
MSEAPSSTSPIVIEGVDGLEALVGQEIGVSGWVPIDQDEIQRFADVTGDHQWIHVDVERAKKESPFGGPIAHGYLVLSLGPALSFGIFTVSNVTLAVNYGLDKVRFLTPVPSGSRVRLRVGIAEVRDASMGKLAAFDYTFELEGSEKPACVARALALFA